MSDSHRFLLTLGSNIQPEINLSGAIDLLRQRGEVLAISNAWESHAVGSDGPNFLNAAVLFSTHSNVDELKQTVIGPIESALGRVRSGDKNAPRPIDIDILMLDEKPLNLERWEHTFVVLPMAELFPDLLHPIRHERMIQVAERVRAETWIVKRPEILNSTQSQKN